MPCANWVRDCLLRVRDTSEWAVKSRDARDNVRANERRDEYIRLLSFLFMGIQKQLSLAVNYISELSSLGSHTLPLITISGNYYVRFTGYSYLQD